MSKQRKIDYLTDERRLDRRPVADFHVTGGAVGGVGQIEHRYVEHDLLTVGGLDAPLTQLAVWPMRPGVIVIIAAAAIVMCRACGAGPSGRSRRRTKRALRLLQRAAAACAPAIRTGMKKQRTKQQKLLFAFCSANIHRSVSPAGNRQPIPRDPLPAVSDK